MTIIALASPSDVIYTRPFPIIKMKRTLLIILVFVQFNKMFGQYFAPNELIVNATELRFREEPNQNAKIIDILEDGELLQFLDFVPHSDSEPRFLYYEKLASTWLKVIRKLDGETGYVYGQYVQPSCLALTYGQDYYRLPKLNWYGITLTQEIPFLNITQPVLEGGKHNRIITDSLNSYVIIGTKSEYEEGQFDGTIFHNENLLILKESDDKVIEIGNKHKLKIEVCHDVEFMNSNKKRTIERLYVTVFQKDGKEVLYQELTEQFNHTGNMGFRIRFVGDINKDNLPEILITPIHEKGGRNLWFISRNNTINLQSITKFGTGC